MNEERRTKLELFGRRIERCGMLAAFMAAASPVPDDPIVVPLALMRYNPAKFLLGFFSGKIIVTTGGALYRSIYKRKSAKLFRRFFDSNGFSGVDNHH